jgi:hypothetical protein
VTLFVNADWSAIVPAGSPEAAFGVQPKDAKRLGLLDLPVEDGAEAPDPTVEAAAPAVLRSANALASVLADAIEAAVEEEQSIASLVDALEPEAKEAPKPANKAAKRPASK